MVSAGRPRGNTAANSDANNGSRSGASVETADAAASVLLVGEPWGTNSSLSV